MVESLVFRELVADIFELSFVVGDGFAIRFLTELVKTERDRA